MIKSMYITSHHVSIALPASIHDVHRFIHDVATVLARALQRTGI